MTKAEKAIIINWESELWLNLKREYWSCACEFDKTAFDSWTTFTDWANEHCESVKSALSEWNAVYTLLFQLKLEPDFYNEQHEIAQVYSTNVYHYFQK